MTAAAIGFIAATLTGNHGAEAMLSAFCGRLHDRFPDAKFILFSYYPAADRRAAVADRIEIFSATPARLVFAHLPGALLAAMVPRRLRHSFPLIPVEIRQLSQCRVLVDLAGVAFADGREKFLPFNILTILPAFLLGVPVLKASQAVGPFKRRLNRVAAKLFLPRCASIHARGHDTEANLRSLGLVNLSLTPDAAFLLKDEDRLVDADAVDRDRIMARIAEMRRSKGLVVGLCPNSLIYATASEAYLRVLEGLVAWLIERGFGILILPGATRAADRQGLRNNDLPVIRELLGRIEGRDRAGAVVAVDGDVDATSIRQLIGACDVVVASRFHAMVAALSLAKPTLVLGWGHKYAEAIDEFGVGEWAFEQGDDDPHAVIAKLADLIEQREAVSRKLASVLPDMRLRAMAQIDAAADILIRPA